MNCGVSLGASEIGASARASATKSIIDSVAEETSRVRFGSVVSIVSLVCVSSCGSSGQVTRRLPSHVACTTAPRSSRARRTTTQSRQESAWTVATGASRRRVVSAQFHTSRCCVITTQHTVTTTFVQFSTKSFATRKEASKVKEASLQFFKRMAFVLFAFVTP